MRAFVVICIVSFLPLTSYAALSTGPYDPVSVRILGNLEGNINVPLTDAVSANSSFLASIDAPKAAGLNVVGATGGLTHPACIAETIRRANMKPPQPPPNGDFPCIVPASNGAGIVDGVCFVNVCKGVASTGLDGIMAALKSISSLSGIVSGILSKLIQGGSSAPDGPTPSASDSATPIVTPPLSQSITTADASQSLDMSLLFSQSAGIVQDLLRSLQSPDVQVPRAD